MAVVAAAHPGTPLEVIRVPVQGLLDAAAVILDVQPVAHVQPVAIDG